MATRTKADETVIDLDNITIDGFLIEGVKDEDDMASDSDSHIATQQSIKKYVDDTSRDALSIHGKDVESGAATPSDNDILVFNGTSQEWELEQSVDSIDDTPQDGVVNKSISSNWAYDHENSVTEHGTTGAVVGTTNTQTLDNKTLNTPIIDGTISGTAIKDEDDMISDSAAHLATQQSIKKYVDDRAGEYDSLSELNDTDISGLATGDLLIYDGVDTFDNKQLSGDIASVAADGTVAFSSSITKNDASQTLTNKTIDADNNIISNLEHGSEVDNPVSGVHGVVGDVVGTSDTQTLSNKTLSAPTINDPVLNTGVSGTAIKDEDDMASDSATHLCTQQSIKKYVDDTATGFNTIEGLTDTVMTGKAAGSILFYDGVNSWDAKTMNGDASIDEEGTITLHPSQRTNQDFYYLSDEVSLLSTGSPAITIDLPDTEMFFINEVGIIITELDGDKTVSTQPTIEFKAGSDTIRSAAITTALDDEYKRENYDVSTSSEGEQGYTDPTTLTANITVAGAVGGTSTLYRAKFYFKGIAITI